MSGFLRDYIINYERLYQDPHARRGVADYGILFARNAAHSSTLAREFAVYDSWFCAVPSQTFCNRSFFHASTSHGFVTNKHGGCYDHAPPPNATPPDSSGAGEMGFEFDRLGCRVPAIAVSAYTRAGTVINDEMHHGSVIATLNRLHGLESLTRLDATANDILNLINLSEPRHPADWPITSTTFTPPNPEEKPPHPAHAHKDKPPTPLAHGPLGLLLARAGLPVSQLTQTFLEAYELLQEHGHMLCGIERFE